MANLGHGIRDGLSGRVNYTAVEIDDIPKKPISGKKQHWGYHLRLDVSECNKGIDDRAAVRKFFKELVADLKMKTLTDVIFVRPPKGDGRGLTAMQAITTSSITFHGDDDEWSAYIDVFSCEVFDPHMAVACVKRHFSPKHIGGDWAYRDAGPWPKK